MHARESVGADEKLFVIVLEAQLSSILDSFFCERYKDEYFMQVMCVCVFVCGVREKKRKNRLIKERALGGSGWM
jgi:hypothetical protein